MLSPLHPVGDDLFPSGKLLIAHEASHVLSVEDITKAMHRHFVGDWGDVDPRDKKQNDLAVEKGGRILSSYRSSSGQEFWVITEADRSATTFLLPGEY